MTSEAQRLIDESMGHDCIATGTWTAGLAADLLAASSNHVASEDVIEYWADSDEQGDDSMKWRVHLKFDFAALRTEAAAAGDEAQVELCDRAIDGDGSAIRECIRVIRDAAAQ